MQDLGRARPLAALVATRWAHEAIGRVTDALHEAALPESVSYGEALRGDALSRWLILAGFIAIGFLLAVGLQRLKDR